jgi:hypothetical protein
MLAPKTMCGYAFFEEARFISFFLQKVPNTILDASFPALKKEKQKVHHEF